MQIFNECSFALKQIDVLLKFRSKNDTDLTHFTSTLLKLFQTEKSPSVIATSDQKVFTVEDKPKSFFKSLKAVVYHWRLSCEILKQAKNKKELKIYGIDPIRLQLQNRESIDSILLSHTKSGIFILEKWFSNRTTNSLTIGFDPKLKLNYQSAKKNVRELILSPWALIFMVFHKPVYLLHFPKIYAEAQKLLRSNFKNTKSLIASSLLISVFLLGGMALRSLVRGEVRMLSMTSNSLFLEALRALILSNSGGQVIEIQHGIATPQFDEYFLSYLPILMGNEFGRLDIIPMLPPPFCADAVSHQNFKLTTQPSNTGIFKTLLELDQKAKVVDNSANGMSKIDAAKINILKFAEQFCTDGVPIFAIYGGTDFSNDYYTNEVFKLEMLLVEMFSEAFFKNQQPVKFLYLPHPKNKAISQVVSQSKLSICAVRPTQASYFIADYAFALYSSSIFEAASMGSHAYSPMQETFTFFHKRMLQEINIPSTLSKDGILNSIETFVKLKPKQAHDHRAKVLQRVDNFFKNNG